MDNFEWLAALRPSTLAALWADLAEGPLMHGQAQSGEEFAVQEAARARLEELVGASHADVLMTAELNSL